MESQPMFVIFNVDLCFKPAYDTTFFGINRHAIARSEKVINK